MFGGGSAIENTHTEQKHIENILTKSQTKLGNLRLTPPSDIVNKKNFFLSQDGFPIN